MAVLAAPYRPRRPHETALYRAVHRHLETFIAHAAETYDAPLPKYVQEELRRYLRCGDFAQGFTHARCEACGHDLLVAFSCKARGACPSCAGRRMANTAAHLVDRVIPAVPVRQWVLSLPFELRARAAFDAKVLTALVRAFAKALGARHRSWARSLGIEAEFGAITFVQRFGSSLNLNVHFHVVVIDGVFSRDDERRLLFTPAPPPTRAEMLTVVGHVRERATKLLRQCADEADEDTRHKPLDTCAQIALGRGDVRAVGDDDDDAADEVAVPHREGEAVDDAGFNLEASVRIDAADDFGREHLLRYCARPPLSLARLRELPGGKLAYRIKKLPNGRAKVRVMTPLELLARLAALVPPPRHPLVRFHGVVAPRSSWRRDVVPKSPEERKHPFHHATPNRPKTEREPNDEPTRAAKPTAPSPRSPLALVPHSELIAPNVLSVSHWNRLRSGALLATSPRVDWASLLRRTFDADVLECPKCAGRLRVLGVVDEPDVVRAFLNELAIAPLHPAVEHATRRRSSPTTNPTADNAQQPLARTATSALKVVKWSAFSATLNEWSKRSGA